MEEPEPPPIPTAEPMPPPVPKLKPVLPALPHKPKPETPPLPYSKNRSTSLIGKWIMLTAFLFLVGAVASISYFARDEIQSMIADLQGSFETDVDRLDVNDSEDAIAVASLNAVQPELLQEVENHADDLVVGAAEPKTSVTAIANSIPNDAPSQATTTNQMLVMPIRPPNEPAVDTASNTLGGSQDAPPPIADEVPKPLLHLSFDDSESKDLHLQNATYAIGKMGRAIQFDGQGFASVNAALPIGNAPRSLSVWLKDTRGPLQNQLIHAVTQGHKPGTAFGIMQANGKWRFFDFNGGLDSGQTVDRQWHHHCVTFDGTTVTYYFDGKPSGEVKRALNTAVAPLMLGTYGDDIEPEKRFVGLIDEVKVFGISLSPEQVEKVMW